MGMMWFWLLLGISAAVLVWPLGRAIAGWRRRRREARALERRHASGEIGRDEYQRQLAERGKSP